jgi:hypothetical protein
VKRTIILLALLVLGAPSFAAGEDATLKPGVFDPARQRHFCRRVPMVRT